jgi:Domain of unknown function (DUF5916)
MLRSRQGLLRIATSGVVLLAVALNARAGTAQSADGADAARERTAAARYPLDVENAPRPVARAVKAAGIIVDGRLDEAAWRQAPAITDFIQAQPRTGFPATDRTVAHVVYDDKAIYVGAFMYQKPPFMVPSLEWDFDTHDSDIFAVTFDTYLDRRNAFMWLINPDGAVKDGQVFNDSRDENLAWKGVIRVQTAKSDSGWSVELQIPWTTLRFESKPGEQAWGMQMLRRVRSLNEDDYWAPVDRRDRVHRMSRAGTLTGLNDLHQGRDLYVKPYIKLGSTSTAATTPDGAATASLNTSGSLNAGFDVKWGVTPTMTLDGTYNTDFSQTEVDQDQVNLTRFSLFFPELRDFFIENSGVFTFGDVTERNYRMGSSLSDFTLFHSRRIGLTDDGRPIPILGGARLTGTAGPFQLGLLEMQTRAGAGIPPENFLVTRLRRDIGASDVGVMFINRAATDGGPASRSWGVDGNFTFLRNLIINSYIAGSANPGARGDQTAARLQIAWRDRLWDASAFAKHVGARFAPSVGFVQRSGVEEYYGTMGIHPRLGLIPAIYELNPYVELDYVTDPASTLQTRRLTAGLAADLLSGGSLEVKASDHYERLDAPFLISDGVTLPVGGYEFPDATLTYTSSGGRKLSGSISLGAGDFYDGTKASVELGALWRPSAHVSIDLTMDRNRVALDEGSFNAEVAAARLVLATSRKLFTSAFMQYDNASHQLVTNLRLDWIHAPLSDLFIVLVDRRDASTRMLLERTLALKVTKLVGF